MVRVGWRGREDRGKRGEGEGVVRVGGRDRGDRGREGGGGVKEEGWERGKDGMEMQRLNESGSLLYGRVFLTCHST